VKDDKDISVSRAVGRFLGHIWGATSKPVPEDEQDSHPEVIQSNVEEAQGEMNNKKVILRRTTIDEIEMREDS
jgi:hypothetical protein